MKNALIMLAVAVFAYSCQQSSEKEKAVIVTEPVEEVSPPLEMVIATEEKVIEPSSSFMDSVTAAKLGKLYAFIPFYTRVNNRTLVMVSDAEQELFDSHLFKGICQYGLVSDSLEIILPINYDKIYNPNTVLLNCLEIKKDEKIGLFNFATQEVLNPRFDFILSGGTTIKDFAYGYRLGQWYEIHSESLNHPKKVDLGYEKILKALAIDTRHSGENLMFEFYPGHLKGEEYGTFIIPSYIEHLNFDFQLFYSYVLNKRSEENENTEYVSDQVVVKLKDNRSISDKIVSFFVSIYEEGVDTRGYVIEKEQMVLYHSEKQAFTSVPLTSLNNRDLYREAAYKLIGDSIIEIKGNQHEYKLENQFYNFETQYRYLHISTEGKVTELDSDRHFDFTKYTFIDESYLTGHFARYVEGSGYNIWESDHLTIEDLDVMRNEIYAEYGYRFRSNKWRYYFSEKQWYHPRYNNVDDQLTAIDKANLKVILKVRKAMEGREQAFTNRRKGVYAAAG